MLKKLSYIIVGALIFASCSLDRLPLNGPSSGTFPASIEEAEAGVLAAYKGLSLMNAQSTTFPYRLQDAASDLGTYRVGSTNVFKQMNSTLTSEQTLVEKHYSYIYKVVGRVHLVLDNLENLRGKAEDAAIDRLKAELLCIRAQQYDMGCQFFGDIPFIDHSLSLDDYTYARTPREEVTERLLNDLDDDLLDNLPIQWPVAENGTTRVSRVAAYTLKARIALNWGHYEEAARCSAKAIALAEGVYGLETLDCTYYPTHADGEPSAANLFGYAGQNSKEWLWAIQYNRLVGGLQPNIYRMAPRPINGCSWHGPSQAMIDTFQCTDGLPITESPLYDWRNPWANRDPRLDLFCLRPGSRSMGIQHELSVAIEKVMNYVSGELIANAEAVGNKSEYGSNGTKGPGGYMWRKFYDQDYYGRISGDKTEDDLNVGIMRYAELLLIDAEANIEWEGGNLARAKSQLDKIRARVNMPPVIATDREGLRTALRYERKVELCAEGFRWFDIRRWGIASKAVNGVMYAPGYSTVTNPTNYISNAKPTFDKDWLVTYDKNNTWEPGQNFNLREFQNMIFQEGKDELWPFPYTEMISNPAIGLENNNPGY